MAGRPRVTVSSEVVPLHAPQNEARACSTSSVAPAGGPCRRVPRCAPAPARRAGPARRAPRRAAAPSACPRGLPVSSSGSPAAPAAALEACAAAVVRGAAVLPRRQVRRRWGQRRDDECAEHSGHSVPGAAAAIEPRRLPRVARAADRAHLACAGTSFVFAALHALDGGHEALAGQGASTGPLPAPSGPIAGLVRCQRLGARVRTGWRAPQVGGRVRAAPRRHVQRTCSCSSAASRLGQFCRLRSRREVRWRRRLFRTAGARVTGAERHVRTVARRLARDVGVEVLPLAAAHLARAVAGAAARDLHEAAAALAGAAAAVEVRVLEVEAAHLTALARRALAPDDDIARAAGGAAGLRARGHALCGARGALPVLCACCGLSAALDETDSAAVSPRCRPAAAEPAPPDLARLCDHRRGLTGQTAGGHVGHGQQRHRGGDRCEEAAVKGRERFFSCGRGVYQIRGAPELRVDGTPHCVVRLAAHVAGLVAGDPAGDAPGRCCRSGGGQATERWCSTRRRVPAF